MESLVNEKEQEIISPSKMVLNRLKKNKLAMLGLILIIIIVLFSFVGPFFMKYGYNTHTDDLKMPPGGGHVLGTDYLGRDMLTRLMFGGRISILVGVVAVLIETIVGTLVGAIAGYYKGKVDSILMSITDIFLALPFLPIILVLGSVLSDLKVSASLRIVFLIFIIGILSWPTIARLVRGEILSLREQEFMQATEALGLRDRRKIIRHLIPNVIPVIIVNATLGIASAILTESALSYLGMGVAEPVPSWGNMITIANNLPDFKNRPWLWVPPGICILIITMGVNLLGDGLRDALDPKMKR
ncbi:MULTISPECIES: oligopeptide ABC transporter permease [Clostridium]|uniref:ABC transporter permease n=1 Tax=Clostridium cibarium TaxID=2762247 RepID=A0ABR8PWM0_9CLOT|nr:MULTISPECIES: oligopeptide ABC transporter permease [Clostridium]MBD7912539.1 ABC transporter permease [Clostridium cibarium]